MLDQWFDVGLFTPLWEVEKDEEYSSSSVGSTIVVCAIERVLQGAACKLETLIYMISNTVTMHNTVGNLTIPVVYGSGISDCNREVATSYRLKLELVGCSNEVTALQGSNQQK